MKKIQPLTLEDTFTLSVSPPPLKTKSAEINQMKSEMSQEMHRQIHTVFEKIARTVPALQRFTINYDNTSSTEDDAVLRFNILPENRLLSEEIAPARMQIEEFLETLIACCPDDGAMRLDARPSTFTYDLHYNTNSLIDALYNMMRNVFDADSNECASLFTAGHILNRIKDYVPANKLN